MGLFSGQTVLVTGGTGSIGSALVRRLLTEDAAAIRVFSRDESKQFALEQEFRRDRRLRMIIGDVRSRDRLERAFKGADVVFHAAAMKHVPACEFNPFEATMTNVNGTHNVVEAAIDNGVKRVLMVSTDKAVVPLNVMGATKLLSERLIMAAERYKGAAVTRFGAVRFGNVIGSRGSVVPLFHGQIARGGPVTLTDPEMIRYLMPTSDAVRLCIDALTQMEGGELFVLRMPRVRVGDVCDVLIEALAPQYGFQASDIEVELIGLRPGEKHEEKLLTPEEQRMATARDGMFVVPPVDRGFPDEGDPVEEEPVLDREGTRRLLDAAGALSRQQLPALG